jgi:hypothetical protein
LILIAMSQCNFLTGDKNGAQSTAGSGKTQNFSIWICVLFLWIGFSGSWAFAFPDGAPWDSGSKEDGCAACHFGSPLRLDSRDLQILGRPDSIKPGGTYALKVRFTQDEMALAGFLLSAFDTEGPVGTFTPVDKTTSTQNAQARSTLTGSVLTRPGMAEWRLKWVAPADLTNPVSFVIWASAANDDQSPFGDFIHHRTWRMKVTSNR